MKIYLKIHYHSQGQVIAACDENILGRSFNNKNIKIDINTKFYGGELISINEGIDILEKSNNFNIAGVYLINAAIKRGIITENAVLKIEEIPIAMKFAI